MARIVNLATLDELERLREEAAPASRTVPEEDDVECGDAAEGVAPDYSKVLSSLQNRCVKREYCSADMMKKALKAFGGNRELASKALESLVADRFVDDARYAAAFAREKSSLTGWGPSKIRYALTLKGIGRVDADAALQEIDADASDRRMMKLLSAKWKVLREDPYGKFKLIKYGLSRGYDYSDVDRAVRSLCEEEI